MKNYWIQINIKLYTNIFKLGMRLFKYPKKSDISLERSGSTAPDWPQTEYKIIKIDNKACISL